MLLPNKKYDIIYADPPWSFKNYSKIGEEKNANQHYDCMTIKDICKLLEHIIIFKQTGIINISTNCFNTRENLKAISNNLNNIENFDFNEILHKKMTKAESEALKYVGR